MAAFRKRVQKIPRGIHVKNTGLQRHHHFVGHFEHILECPAAQACRGVQHHMTSLLWRLRQIVRIDFPFSDGMRMGRPQAQPQAGGFLRIRVAQTHGMALRSEITSDIGGQGGFACTPLGVDNDDKAHGALLNSG